MWEYLVIGAGRSASDDDQLRLVLSEQGAEGWELVSAVFMPAGFWHLIFKRPVSLGGDE